jgi:hypothetical protein
MRVYFGSQDGAIVHYWSGKYPNLVGQCFSPPQFKPRAWIPYFLDNGAYKYWANNQPFNEQLFWEHLTNAKWSRIKPDFVVMPDCVGDHDRTLELWHNFAPRVRYLFDFKLAFVAQDGCTPDLVPDCDFVFMGGTDDFKKPLLKDFADRFQNLHVGRVNNLDFVYRCFELGITSVDGTGWFRSNHGKPIYPELESYFEFVVGRGAEQLKL